MATETDENQGVGRGGGGEREAVDCFYELPEGCIANIVSLTTPRDACRLCLVSTVCRSAAESDAVWERFLPPEYPSLLSHYSLPCPSKKHLFFSLCDRPLLIDQGTKSFSLEKRSGKKCYMLSARALSIVWGDTPRYWRWIPLPEARFEDVAELVNVCWFEIRGKIDVQMLSPSTLYTANLVFKSTLRAYGFERQPVEATVGLVRGEASTRSVYLDAQRGHRMRYQIVPWQTGRYLEDHFLDYETEASPPREVDNDQNHPKEREDGWLEVELGEFFCDGKQEGELEISVLEVRAGHWKSGLIVQGIEIKPKRG